MFICKKVVNLFKRETNKQPSQNLAVLTYGVVVYLLFKASCAMFPKDEEPIDERRPVLGIEVFFIVLDDLKLSISNVDERLVAR